MRTLVIGATGEIGSRLMVKLRSLGHDCTGTARFPEVSDKSMLQVELGNISESIEIITRAGTFDSAVFAAGTSSLSKCQSNPELTAIINVEAHVELARALLSMGCSRIVCLSTSRVFDGSTELVASDAEYSPKTEYGRQKARVETELLKFGSKVGIVRFTKVLSADNKLINDWASKLTGNEKIQAFDDVKISPITVDTAVDIIERVLVDQFDPVTQFSATDEISFYEMGKIIANHLNVSVEAVEPQCAQDINETIVEHSSLESSVIASIVPMSSSSAVELILQEMDTI